MRPPLIAVALALGAAALLTGCGDDVETRPAAWTLVRESGRTLFLEVETDDDGCSAVHRADSKEDEDSVQVVVRVRETDAPDGRCERDDRPIQVVILAPRNDRTLTGCNPDDPDAVCEAAKP